MTAWYDKAIFYHMYPLGMTGAPFANPYPVSDGTADGTRDVSSDSRMDELMQWIPYLESLHISAIYIGPLFESSTHGYDTRDFRLIDRRLGTNVSFRSFVDCCHEHGIRVVVDGVFNHTGREFFAFRDLQAHRDQSPYAGWYRNVNFGWGSPLGDSFGYESWHGIWELPCLNHRNPEVRNYLLDTVRFWVQEFDIDGIRLDCAGDLSFEFMQELRRLANEIKPEFWLMGEVIHGEYARWVNPQMLHSVTNYEMHKSIYSAHNDHNYFELAHNVRRLEAVGRDLYTFVDNHDEDRIASKLLNPAHLAPLYTLLFTLPGIRPSIMEVNGAFRDAADTTLIRNSVRESCRRDRLQKKCRPATDKTPASAQMATARAFRAPQAQTYTQAQTPAARPLQAPQAQTQIPAQAP